MAQAAEPHDTGMEGRNTDLIGVGVWLSGLGCNAGDQKVIGSNSWVG